MYFTCIVSSGIACLVDFGDTDFQRVYKSKQETLKSIKLSVVVRFLLDTVAVIF